MTRLVELIQESLGAVPSIDRRGRGVVIVGDDEPGRVFDLDGMPLVIVAPSFTLTELQEDRGRIWTIGPDDLTAWDALQEALTPHQRDALAAVELVTIAYV